MTNLTSVTIAGANGRMGRELLQASLSNEQIELVGALVRAGSSHIGESAAQLAGAGAGPDSNNSNEILCTSQDEPLSNTQVLIDFTLPGNTITNLKNCVAANVAIVIGTTGFSPEQQSQIDEAAKSIPVLQASNMSLGFNLTLALLKQAAKILGSNAKISITETHHIHKLDAPSGTAITMSDAITETLDATEDNQKLQTIKMESIREGEVVGDHQVTFEIADETIEIAHKAGSRQIFANGAVKAALWLGDKDPGHYSMEDVLGL